MASFCSSFTISFESSSITLFVELGLNVSLMAVQRAVLRRSLQSRHLCGATSKACITV